MNKDLIFRKIGGIVSEISEQYAYLATNPESINPLELELLIANSHFLSEHLSILKKIDTNDHPAQDQVKKEPEMEKITQSIINLSATKNFEPNDARNLSADFSRDDRIEEIRPEISHFSPIEAHDSSADTKTRDNYPNEPVEINLVISEEVIIPIAASIPTEAEHIVADPAEEFVIEKIVSSENAKPDSTVDRVPTLNEILSAGMKDKNIVPKLNFDEAMDLKSMIKLNDKLLFVRDLFNGYSLAYNEALELMNRFDSVEAAQNFLKQNYAAKNNWNDKQDVADKFYDLLARRFSK